MATTLRLGQSGIACREAGVRLRLVAEVVGGRPEATAEDGAEPVAGLGLGVRLVMEEEEEEDGEVEVVEQQWGVEETAGTGRIKFVGSCERKKYETTNGRVLAKEKVGVETRTPIRSIRFVLCVFVCACVCVHMLLPPRCQVRFVSCSSFYSSRPAPYFSVLNSRVSLVDTLIFRAH